MGTHGARPILGLLGACCLAAPVLAQTNPRDRVTVSVDWLAAHLSDPDLVILHVENDGGYATEHIAGARLVGDEAVITAPHTEGGLNVEFADDQTLERQLEDLGVGDRSTVVVLGAGRNNGSISLRAFWTLYYAGLGDRAKWLDGGFNAWKEAGKPVTKEVPPPRKGQLTLRPVRGFVADAEFVQSHAGKPGYAVVDARGDAFYDGTRPSSGGKAGHIPGAVSIGVTTVYTDDGHLRPNAELEALFTKAGVRPGDVVVAYCHIGIYANSIIMAASVLGHEVMLYDGSFEDWAKRDLPVTAQP